MLRRSKGSRWESIRCRAGRRQIRESTARHNRTGRSYSKKSVRNVVTFVLACFSCGVFIIALVGFNESGDLDQLNVGVEKVNQPKGYRMILTVAGGDETRRPVIKPFAYGILRGRRVFMSSNTRRSKYRQIRKTQEGRVEENMGGIIVIGKGGSESERSFQCFGTMGTLSKSDCGGKSASRSMVAGRGNGASSGVYDDKSFHR